MSIDNLSEEDREFVYQTKLFQEFREKNREILEYKWLESERQGHDIGIDCALVQWNFRHNAPLKPEERSEVETDFPT